MLRAFQLLPIDCGAYVFAFLDPHEQGTCRLVSHDFCFLFDIAFEHGYVGCAIHYGLVENVRAFFSMSERDHEEPFRVAPANPRLLEWRDGSLLRFDVIPEDSSAGSLMTLDSGATMVVHVQAMLGSAETSMQNNFMRGAPFRAVHFIETEALETIGANVLLGCPNLEYFSMCTPCSCLYEAAQGWLTGCHHLKSVDFSGCSALCSVGSRWMRMCTSLARVELSACVALVNVDTDWMYGCAALEEVDLSKCKELTCVGTGTLRECINLKRVFLPHEWSARQGRTRLLKTETQESVSAMSINDVLDVLQGGPEEGIAAARHVLRDYAPSRKGT